MPYSRFDGELDSPNNNILAKFENVPALRKADIALNQLAGGGPETISARVGREQDQSPAARMIAAGLNAIDPGHTDRAVSNSNLRQSYVPFNGELDSPPIPVQPPRTLTQDILRQLGLTARAGISGVTGTAGIVGDALNSGINLATGSKLPMPSQIMQQGMNSIGLPQPQGVQENIVQALASTLAGSKDPLLNIAQASQAAKVPAGYVAAQADARNQVVKELHDAGIVLPPSVAETGFLSRVAEGIGGKTQIADKAKFKNSPVINDLARQALKLPEGTPITGEILDQQAKNLIQTGYEPVKQLGTITTGRVYRNALDDIQTQFSSKSFPLADKQEVLQLVNQYRVKNFQADDALKAISQLRMEAKDAFKPGGDSSIGKAKLAITKALEDNIELNLQSRGATNPAAADILNNFKSARVALAKNYAVGRMLQDPDTGTISAVKAANMVRSGKLLTDELSTIAKAGSPQFSRATAPPSVGNSTPVNFGDSMYYGGGLGLGVFTGGLSLPLAAVPVAKGIIRSTTLSKPMQNMMMRSLANKQPSIFGDPITKLAAAGQILPPTSSYLFGGSQ